MRSIFARKWKDGQLKNLKKLYSTYQTPKTHQAETVFTNISIHGYVKKRRLDLARKLFEEMPERTVVSWNTMISGYSKWGFFEDALSLLSLMHHSIVKLNETTFLTGLSACAHLQLQTQGKQIHCILFKSGCKNFELVGSALLYFYSSCLEIKEAEQVFDEFCDRNELLWSLMLVGYVQCNLLGHALNLFMKMPKWDVVSLSKLISGFAKSEESCEKALELFWWMRSSELVPNEFTFDSVLRACGRLGFLHEGRLVHGILIKYGFEFDQYIVCALIEFYCNCEAIGDAKRVYNGIPNPDLNASNSLMGGLISMDRIGDAELVFNRLTEMNSISFNLMIKGYAISGQVEDSKRLFEEMPERTIISFNLMISVYSRNGDIDKALNLFEEIQSERNPVTWNSMISGYIENGQYKEALKLYQTMHRLSIDRTRSIFSVLFYGCSCLGSLQQGQLLHAHLVKTPFQSNVYVGTSLTDMYSKCGSISDAHKSFTDISSPNVAAWTTLVNAYAYHGLGLQAVLIFQHMQKRNVYPNAATFVGILSACAHAGLLMEGMKLFQSMEMCYEVTPTSEHYACVVDLLGRSGHLQEAEKFIRSMPIEADGAVWGALLNACWLWMDMEVGERVAEKVLSLNPKQTYAYVILSNIFAVLGKWVEKMNVRRTLNEMDVKKDPGCSWVELNSVLHAFSVEDRSHPHFTVIYSTLQHLNANLNTIVHCDFDSI
ncbi:hypothetical protein SLA2020_129970 [Shorea laevis]